MPFNNRRLWSFFTLIVVVLQALVFWSPAVVQAVSMTGCSEIYHNIQTWIQQRALIVPTTTKITSPKFLIYIVADNEDSLAMATTFSTQHVWAKPMLIHRTKYFESIVYMDYLPFRYNEWKDLDYIGIMSYEVASTQFAVTGSMEALVSAAGLDGYDVLPFVRSGLPLLTTAAVKVHETGFATSWRALLAALGIPAEVVELHSVSPLFQNNAFACRPLIMKELILVMSAAIQEVNFTPSLAVTMELPSKIVGPSGVAQRVFNKPQFELHPFVFENLPVFLVNLMKVTVCMGKTREDKVCPLNA
jgi:hypothetical protein